MRRFVFPLVFLLAPSLAGAETVTIAYRRSQTEMGASRYEQDLAASKGVTIRANLAPAEIRNDAIDLAYTTNGNSGLEVTGEIIALQTDQVLVAIGQTLDDPLGLSATGARLRWTIGLPRQCKASGRQVTVLQAAMT